MARTRVKTRCRGWFFPKLEHRSAANRCPVRRRRNPDQSQNALTDGSSRGKTTQDTEFNMEALSPRFSCLEPRLVL